MDFGQLRQQIKKYEDYDFISSSKEMENIIFSLDRDEIIDLIPEIGIIPEDISHDSSEEKLYSKTSDIIFAKALECMGFDVNVLRERADAADIVARSRYHGYSLVGDAKVFRLSRTAKNAKDFKVDSMVNWRRDNDFSVLSCPYFQYPNTSSQIYKEALNGNVMLFSWEWLYICLKEGVVENKDLNLRDVWNQSAIIGAMVSIADSKRRFIEIQDEHISRIIGISNERVDTYFNQIKEKMRNRGHAEILYYQDEIERVKRMDRDEAIKELLEKMKLTSKIETIREFINRITDD